MVTNVVAAVTVVLAAVCFVLEWLVERRKRRELDVLAADLREHGRVLRELVEREARDNKEGSDVQRR